MPKKKISRLKQLEKENEKLRAALVHSLMPLHLMSQFYGRPSMKEEMKAQAKEALKQAKAALAFDSLHMAMLTDTDEEEWDEFLEDFDEFLGTKDDEDDEY